MMIGTESRPPMYPTIPHMWCWFNAGGESPGWSARAGLGLLDAFFGPLVRDLAGAHFVERGRHGLVGVDALGQRRGAVVELLGALRHDVDEGEFGVDVLEEPVEIAEYAVAHL